MRSLNINFHFDEARTIELNNEVNYYLREAKEKGICTHINCFYFYDVEVQKSYQEDGSAVYSLKKTDKSEYYERITVRYDKGRLVNINFETWRNDWDGQQKICFDSTKGARILSVCRGLSVTANGESFYECESGKLATLE